MTETPAAAQDGASIHDPWTAILQAHVSAGPDGVARFDYGAVSEATRTELDDYIASLEATQVSALHRDAQMAFWINLYNAVTVRVILDHYPVPSIRRIKFGNPFALGPWGRNLVTIEGRELSLDNIEHDILRPEFGDNRIHYGVNCASLGCPDLQAEAFLPETLDAQLDAAARGFINHPRGVSLTDGRLTASSIYDWFSEDFGNNEAEIIAHLQLYADPGLRNLLQDRTRIDRYDYSWAINDAPEGD